MGRALSQEMSTIGSSGNFDHGFDFDRRVHGKRGCTDRRTRVAAPVAESGHQEVRRAVGYKVLLGEIRRRGDEDGDLDDAADALQIAERSAGLRQYIDGTPFGRKLA